MKYFKPTNLSIISLILGVDAFQPSFVTRAVRRERVPSFELLSTKDIDVDFFNPCRDIDLEHAHDCAEHFGKCSIEELETMRSALHTERIQHKATDYESDLVEDLDHLLLEEDLSFQLALLKDEMHTLPKWSSPHFINDGKPSFSPPQMTVDSSGGSTAALNPTEHHSPNLQSFIQRGEEMFLFPNGLSEIAAFGAAILIVSLAPVLLNH